ncbi:RING-H2 finger protein ATL39-like [Cucumis sativus]|uniref:RING-type domain-containing protein n=1 Tax=Cucumis sativus TaxID=3659 RepID=A0A0A0L062_CUCSA|nr:RING-H2 finger protein ATL39-like [Cucumis sativus]
MGDPLLTLLFPMETMVPESPSPPVLHYTVTLDIRTSIIFSFSIILFFLFLFHVLSGFLQWFLDVRRNGGGGEDVEAAMAEERRLKRAEKLPLPPTVRFGSEKMVRRRSEEECAICLEEFLIGENCQALPECNHFFHSECIDVWFSKKFTCPICRNCVAA